jgi:hypothetical protein
VITGAYYSADSRLDTFGLGLSKNLRPVAGSDLITGNKLSGKIINDIVSGSWLVWTIPQPVYIDGRLEVMKEQLAQEYASTFRGNGLQFIIKKYQPQIILFNYVIMTGWLNQMLFMSNWRLVYLDENCAIYLHKDYAPYVKSFSFEDIYSKIDVETSFDSSSILGILKMEKKTGFSRWLDGFYQKRDYPRIFNLTNLAFFSSLHGRNDIAETLYLNALRESDDYAGKIYLMLASVYSLENKHDKELICYEKALEYEPDNETVKKNIYELRKVVK